MSLLGESAAQLDLVVFDELVSVYTVNVSMTGASKLPGYCIMSLLMV